MEISSFWHAAQNNAAS